VGGAIVQLEYALPAKESWLCPQVSCYVQLPACVLAPLTCLVSVLLWWHQCGVSNFAHRDLCFRCQSPKNAFPPQLLQHASEEAERSNVSLILRVLESPTPTRVLLLRFLSLHTTEEAASAAIRMYAPITDLRLVRDRMTGAPRGVAFVQLSCIEHAQHTVQASAGSKGLRIDDKMVKVSFAKGDSIEYLLAEAMSLLGQAQLQHPTEQQMIPMPAIYGAAMEAHIQQANSQPPFDFPAGGGAGARPSQLAPREWPLPFEEAGASYVIEASSGYFFEAVSGTYYDPKSRLYSKGDKWYKHTPGQQPPYTLVEAGQPGHPALHGAGAVADAAPQDAGPSTLSEEKRKGKLSFGLSKGKGKAAVPLVIKKHAQDISKWSERKKEEEPEPPPQPLTQPGPGHVAMSAPDSKVAPALAAVQEAESILNAMNTSAVGAAPAASAKKSSFQHACMLCQRGFKSAEQLQKHEAKSSLHAENLKKYRVSQPPSRPHL
jgi:hypothetical protein